MKPAEYLDALLALPGMRGVLVRRGGTQVSRDGRWVAWTWVRTAPANEVYVAPSDGSSPPVRLTDTPENTFLVSWTPDSKAVLVRQDKSGNERTQLFRVDIDKPLTMIPLTKEDPDYFTRGGDLHPNGKWLVYGANYDDAAGQEIEQTCVYRHDLETGDRIVLARQEKGSWMWPVLSPTGDHVLYTRRELDPTGVQTWLVDINGENDREILNFGDDVKTFATWFPDGERLVVRVETETHMRLGVMTLTNGDIRWLIDNPARNIENAYISRGDKIVVIEAQQARSQCSLLDPDSGEENALPEIPGNLIPIAPLESGGWAGMYDSSRQPAEVARFDWDETDPDKFTSLSQVWERTTLSRDDLTQAENFTWQSVDGLKIQGWLYRAENEAYGTVVSVHGGPSEHSKDAINNEIQYYVRQGFNVLDPNYRGSTGFGLEFRKKLKEDGWGGKEQDDIRAGIEALIEAGIAQPGKVGLTGTSYGGYAAWCAITRFPPDVLAASVPICGIADLVVDYETMRPDLRPLSEEMLGGSPSEVPETYYERSPINFIDNIKGRLLIVQGMQDPNVSPENVSVATSALQKAGVEYELLTFDDEGHGINKPKNQKVLYEYLHKFFESAFED